MQGGATPCCTHSRVCQSSPVRAKAGRGGVLKDVEGCICGCSKRQLHPRTGCRAGTAGGCAAALGPVPVPVPRVPIRFDRLMTLAHRSPPAPAPPDAAAWVGPPRPQTRSQTDRPCKCMLRTCAAGHKSRSASTFTVLSRHSRHTRASWTHKAPSTTTASLHIAALVNLPKQLRRVH